jgi:UDP-3-O-[3-hydroxymyristoyl] glucosamine N-acyltransferase
MPDPRFFTASGPTPLKDLVLLTGAKLRLQADAVRVIKGVAPLDSAGPDDLSFFDNRRYKDVFITSNAGACFSRPADAELAPATMAVLIHDNPYHAYAIAADALFPKPVIKNRISENAFIHETATIGSGCEIHAGVVIGPNAEIGSRCVIEANAVISRAVKIGNDCRIGACASISHALIGNRVCIYPGVRIGQDGFGYALSPLGHVKVPQLGRVIIEDDVEIGANTTIDRGSGPDTVIGKGAIIDNLVMIAHNVKIGPMSVLVAQSGVAGSSTLGPGAVLAAQAGVAGHLKIGAGARIGGQSGVIRDIPDAKEYLGTPAVPVRQFFRQFALLEKMATKSGNEDAT